ncbi:hypothetical protein RF11_09956 [Thelohanellus kitauei]|uniref:Serpin domain-containing protein n=1 Tax=Thelohanellus kitauei TaxID=669202 RepID=A0A0C2IUE4_THEKT|nr:hypothetical protein RF11_09956 [Thelohanellus kitauei]
MSAESVNEFTRTIFNYIYATQGSTGNIAFSGFGLYSLMTMINLGLRGKYREQLSNFLKENHTEIFYLLTWKESQFAKTWLDNRKLMESVSDSNSILFHSCRISELYWILSTHLFNLNFRATNFSNPQDLLKKINQWVNQKTRGLIQNLWNDYLDFHTMMVFINTLFFNSIWLIPFDTKATTPGIFFDEVNNPIVVLMMNQDSSYQVYVDHAHNVTILFIPFQQVTVYGVVLLPNLGYSLKDLIRNFQQAQWRTLHLTIPKFQIYSGFDLIDLLMHYNVTEIFNIPVANKENKICHTGLIRKLAQLTMVSIDENEKTANDVWADDIMYHFPTISLSYICSFVKAYIIQCSSNES